MRAPRVRFTVRRLMIAVAVVGIILGPYTTCRNRAARFDERCEWHYRRIDELLRGVYYGDDAAWRRVAARAAWHTEMHEKYDLASRRPWLPVAPDPPEPE